MAHISNKVSAREVERDDLAPRQGEFVPMPDPPTGALDELRAAADAILSQTEMIPAPLLSAVRPVLADIDDKIGAAIAERKQMWDDRELYRRNLHRAIHKIQHQALEIIIEQERNAALSQRIDDATGSI